MSDLPNLPSNSHINRQENKKVDKIISGTAKFQKKGFGAKLSENLFEDTSSGVMSYIIQDVLIPAFKSLISEMVGGGIDMLLFGERRGSKNIRRDGNRSHVSYGDYYDNKNSRNNRDIPRTARARHDFNSIVLDSRGEAEHVLDTLVDLTIKYDEATVADLYELVGANHEFTDRKYGWTDLRDASVRRVRDGYLLDLPRPIVLD